MANQKITRGDNIQGYLVRLAIVFTVVFVFPFLLQTAAANGATITVTGTGDTIAVDGSLTLREAITSINNAANINGDVAGVGTYGINDTINFNIAGVGVMTINLGASLPTISKPMTINGYSQGAAAVNTLANADNAVILIELNGAGAGAGANGLTLGAGSNGSTIRGLAINRFTGNGIVIQSDVNTIIGNFVGVDPTGTTRMPNGTFPNTGDGIQVQNAARNQIGSSSPADRNIVSGNAIDGIHILGSVVDPATGNLVQGNFVGVAADGKSSVGNRTEPAPAPGTAEGNNYFGIAVSGGDNNTIGGTAPGTRNVVGLNEAGIEIDNGGQGNIIQGNFSGVGADGVTPAGNLLQGIVLRSSNGFGPPLGPAQLDEPGVSFNVVGGTSAGSGNLVEFNGTAGVAVFGNPVSASAGANVSNAIEGNSIFMNGRNFATASSAPTPLLGIDLTNGFLFPREDGVTPNDSKGHGAQPDPNNFQNFPVLSSALPNAGKTDVSGTLKAQPNSTYRVEFFANDVDPLGLPAEGQQFLDFATVSTDANGNATFSRTLNVAVANGRSVTATARDAVGNTSEFSAGVVVPFQAPPPGLSINNVSVIEGNGGSNNAVFTVTLSPTSSQVTVDYLTSNGTAVNTADYQSVSGTLTFTPGQTTRTITVPIVGDTVPEPTETFFVNLMNPTNATITTAQGTGTITDDDAAGVFQFSSPTASIAENANPGSINLTINRTGDTSGAASVRFETSDITAGQKTDYTFNSGLVQFGPGDTSKTINVLIVNDAFAEGPETFAVTLSSPSGNFVVANPNSVTVTITDDDAVLGANPIDTSGFFVRQQYLDFLGREPDATGLTFWTNNITGCGADANCISTKRTDTSAAFFLSIEFQETSGNVLRTQRVAFGKQSSDPSTRVTYLQFMRDTRQVGQGVIVGQPGADVLLESNKQNYAAQVVSDPNFTVRFPPAPGPVYVDALFASAGVTPTAAERTAAINAFGAGGTTGRIAGLRSVTDSNSVKQADFNSSFVLAEYYGYLRRNPTDSPDFNDSGYQFWLTKMNAFNGDFRAADMVKSFITSSEYRGRFGTP
jgi:Calx-beta domain